MKKIVTSIGIGVLLIIGGIYFSRNLIIERILERKLTEINKGKVDISKVDFMPFNKKIIIDGINLTSRKNTMKNFISIGKFEADYDIYFKEKKVLINKADFTDISFMTDRSSDGNIGILKREDENVKLKNNEELEKAKNNSVKDLEELISARSKINKVSLENLLKRQYEELELSLKEKKEYWQNKIDELGKTQEYNILKSNYEKIANEKNPLKIIRMEKELKEMGRAFSSLSKSLLANREEMREDLKNITDIQNMETNLKLAVEEVLERGEFIITDLDSIVNFYLNEIYGEKIEKMATKYRTFMREIELRRNEDFNEKNKWEFFAEKIDINTKLYGLELKGGIRNISSRLSKNLENIEVFLTADSEVSHGKIYSLINIGKLEGDVEINISNFDFSDLKDLENLHRYLISGQAGINQKVNLTRDNFSVKGDLAIHNMNINGKAVAQKMNITSPILKDMLIPLLKEVNTGNIYYSYDTSEGILLVKSDLSTEIMKALNNKDGYMKKQIMEKMLQDGKLNLEQYKSILDDENNKTLMELEKNIDDKSEYLEKIQRLLDKFNFTGDSNFLEKILN